MFSFIWFDVSKHWFTFLLASFTLYLWLDRKHTHRKLDELHKTMEVIQHHMVTSISSMFHL